MSFKEFFKKYLMVMPCTCGEKCDTILRLIPAKQKNGKRISDYLVTQEFMDQIEHNGECIFLGDNKCSIQDIKPFGGKFMRCRKMTDGLQLQLSDSQYYVFWYNNQQIYYELSESIEKILRQAHHYYTLAEECYEKYEKSDKVEDLIREYELYVEKADKLMNNDLKSALQKL